MNGVKGFVGTIGAVLVAIVLAELSPITAISTWIDARESRLLVVVGSILAVGLALFLGGIIKMLMGHGTPLSRAEIEDTAQRVSVADRPTASQASRYRVIGAAAGRGGSESFRLGELQAAIRSGAARRDPVWRRRVVTVAGALLLIVGVMGIGVVVGPPWIKVLLAGALLYAFGMIVWAVIRNASTSMPNTSSR